MKKFLLLTTAITALSTAAVAGDFDRIENNVRVESNGVGVSAKLNINDASREMGIDYTKSGFTVGYIRAEGSDDSSDENRPFAAYSVTEGPFYARVQVEYRDFVASGSDDYIRIVPTVGVGKKFSGVNVYGDVTPKVAYGKEGTSNFTEIMETEFKVGFDFEINKNVTAGPFVQYVTDKDWEKQETLFGTSISVKF